MIIVAEGEGANDPQNQHANGHVQAAHHVFTIEENNKLDSSLDPVAPLTLQTRMK